MKKNPLTLAVVGHTNTGKTSLMRTLLRDDGFGEVQNAAATTRHVEEAIISDGKTPLVKLYDTPGLEDAGGLLDWLESETSPKRDGVERIRIFLASEIAEKEFSQEAKVLRQLLDSDAALYVADAREPVLPKYKDELTILSWCARPVMPIFNFIRDSDVTQWQIMLARRNLHVWASFDTVAFDFEGEMRLWASLATMLPDPTVLNYLMNTRRQEWQNLNIKAKQLISEFLLNIAAYTQSVENKEFVGEVQMHMQNVVREIEQKLHNQLFNLYKFYHSELMEKEAWVLQAFSHDPFDGELWKEYGIRTSTSAAAGAMIGLGVDTLTLGFSLGVGTVIGGVIGGLWPHMKTILDKVNGVENLYIDDNTITILAAREWTLLLCLQTRGHAAQTVVELSNVHIQMPWLPEQLPDVLKKARHRLKWSILNQGVSVKEARKERAEAVDVLMRLWAHLEKDS